MKNRYLTLPIVTTLLLGQTLTVFAQADAKVVSTLAAQSVSAGGFSTSLKGMLARLELLSRDIMVARRAVEMSDAMALIAGARPNPVLSINSVGINPQSGIGSGNLLNKRIDTVVRIDQTFERGQKRELRLAAALAGKLAAVGDLTDLIRTAQLALYGTYFDLKFAQERLAYARSTLQSQIASSKAAQFRLNAGDISPTELARISLEEVRAHTELKRAEADLSKAQFALAAQLADEANAAVYRADDPWPAIEEFEQLASIDLDQRADVRAAAARVTQAEESLRLAQSQLTRDVTLGAQIENVPPDGRPVFGIGVAIPLFTNNRFEGEIRAASVNLSLAQEFLTRTRAQAGADVMRSSKELQLTIARAGKLRSDLLAKAEKVAKGAELAYLQGAIPLIDLLDARRSLYAIQLEAIASLSDYAKARAAYAAATNTSP